MSKSVSAICIASSMFLGLAMPLEAGEPIALKVLYAGDIKSDRTKDFQGFLRAHFTTVDIADYLKFNDSLASMYDVIVLDWPDLPPRDKQGFLKPNLGKSYDRPTVLIGGGTLAVGRDQQRRAVHPVLSR